MKQYLLLLTMVALQGCAVVSDIKDWIPSRWDANQSKVITDIRQQTANFDCKADHKTQLTELYSSVQWFQLYSDSKGTKDVSHLLDTLKVTVKEFVDRPQPVSPIYCDLKKKLMIQQADIAAKTIQGRF